MKLKKRRSIILNVVISLAFVVLFSFLLKIQVFDKDKYEKELVSKSTAVVDALNL